MADKSIDELDENKLDEFEDVFSSSNFDVFEISNNTPFEDDFSDADIPDLSNLMKPRPASNTSELLKELENSSPRQAIKRKSQDIKYEDISEIYAHYFPEKEKKKKHHPIRNAFIIILCLFVATTSVFGCLVINKFNNITSSAKQGVRLVENTYINEDLLYSNSMQINILLVGLNSLDNKDYADSITLLTIDHKNGEFKLTSFLPDTYIQISGENAKTISEMYALKGIQGLVDTLELNFKVNIPYYITFYHTSIKTIVDDLGSIEIKITPIEREQINLNVSDNMSLNGEDAFNLLNNEQSNSANTVVAQRKVISAIMKRVISQDFKEFASTIENITPLFTTNISNGKFKNLFLDAIEYKTNTYTVCDIQIPSENNLYYDNIDGVGNCALIDMNKCSKDLKSFLSLKQH